MILVVNLCKEKLHEHEYVRPVSEILGKMGKEYVVKDYFRIRRSDLGADKIIICGTSLRDFEYLKAMKTFGWLREYTGDVLGICAGCQVLVQWYGGMLYECKEIGKTLVKLRKRLFDLPEEFFVYSLHQLGITPPTGFEVMAESDFGVEILRKEDMVDGRKRLILGILFHPEVLNKEIIEGFAEY